MSDSDSRPLLVLGDNPPVAAIQAIFYKLTQKTETQRFSFDEAYKISSAQFVELDTLVSQAIRQYKIEARSTEINVSINHGDSLTFTSIERFKLHAFQTKCQTKSIQYKTTFMTILPTEVPEASTIPQRYTVSILLDQELENEVGMPPYLLRKFFLGDNITVKIEYTDFNVALNIRATIESWVKTLDTEKTNKAALFFLKNESEISLLLPRIALAASLLGATGVFVKNYSIVELPLHESLLTATAISSLVYSFIQIVTAKMFSAIHAIMPKTFLLFTNGDNDRLKKAESKVTSRKAVLTILLTTIIVTIPVSLFTRWLAFIVFGK